MLINLVVDKDKVIRWLGPNQWTDVTRRIAYPEHPQVEQRSHPVQGREVERESRDAQSLDRPRPGIENVRRNIPVLAVSPAPCTCGVAKPTTAESKVKSPWKPT
jgi:hypothetical protein